MSITTLTDGDFTRDLEGKRNESGYRKEKPVEIT
jgi:hypothetical protein